MIGLKETKRLATSPSALWEKEYHKGGIPSSVRGRPSNVVVEFRARVQSEFSAARTALDIGCGTGRNSFYLAAEGFEVTAVDYVKEQIDQIVKQLAADGNLHIRPVCHDIADPWPFPDNAFDIAIDCFCFKHQIHLPAITNYVDQLYRVLRPGAYYLLFLAAKEDGYYRQFPIDEQVGAGTVIIDPANNIASRLYDIAEITSLFRRLNVVSAITKPGVNEMHGRGYERSSHIFHMKKA